MKIVVNKDKELVKEIREKIKQNNGHCCCAIVFNDDNMCMCKEFREKIANKELGFCDCGLYELIEEDAE